MTIHRKRAPRDQAGFSMVELMIVLAVFSLTFAATLPAFRNSMRGHRLQSAANQIETGLRGVRSRAIAEDVSYIVAWIPDDEQFFVVRDDNGNGQPDWNTEPVDGPKELPDGIDLSYVGNDFPNGTLIFRPNGSTNIEGALVLEDAEENKIYIDIIQPSGVIHVLSEDEYSATTTTTPTTATSWDTR